MESAGLAWRTDLIRNRCCTLGMGHRLLVTSKGFFCSLWVTHKCTTCRA